MNHNKRQVHMKASSSTTSLLLYSTSSNCRIHRRHRLMGFLSFSSLLLFILVSMIIPSCCQAGTTADGLKFLAKTKLQDGVVLRPSGLMYKELRPGKVNGKTPTIDSPCSCHYRGTLIDGTEFDSSYKRGEPLTFAPNQVIAGWTEAMQLMKEGAKWELYIPSELGYGDHGAGSIIPGGSVLVFTLELLKVLGKDDGASQ